MFCPETHHLLVEDLFAAREEADQKAREAVREAAELSAVGELIERNSATVLIVSPDGKLGEQAMKFIEHKPLPTRRNLATSFFPSNLGAAVCPNSQFDLSFLRNQCVCVTGVTEHTFYEVVGGIEEWNVNPSCHGNPLETRGADYNIVLNACDMAECDCYPPHVALKGAIVIVDASCERLAEMKRGFGWHVIVI